LEGAAAAVAETTPTLQAILLATSASDAFGPIVEHAPIEMMPLANQPLIGRVAGWLFGLGIKDITILASHRVDLLTAFLGSGSRWGAKIRVVAVASEAQMFARLPELVASDFALIGIASSLPAIGPETLSKCLAAGGGRFVLPNGDALHWSCVSRALFNNGVRDCKSLSEFETHINQSGVAHFETSATVLRSSTPAELLLSTRALLDGLRPDQLVPGACAEKGVYISRNVVMHPTVRITPPVVIGADCNIERGARIGPYAVIGDKTILGAHTTLENAVVFPGTYIGPHLELSNVVVDHNSLAYGDDKGAVPVPDPFLLSTSQSDSFARTLRHFSRRLIATLTLILLCIPILGLYLLGRLTGVKKPVRGVDAVCLPAASDPAIWSTFQYFEFDATERSFWSRLIRFMRATRLPTLWNVVCGEVAWVGLRPLTAAEMNALPADWRQLYGSGKVGIVRLAELDRTFAGDDPDDQTYSSEAYYVATTSWRTDLAILWRGFWSK
jgi:hypothetical protein